MTAMIVIVKTSNSNTIGETLLVINLTLHYDDI